MRSRLDDLGSQFVIVFSGEIVERRSRRANNLKPRITGGKLPCRLFGHPRRTPGEEEAITPLCGQFTEREDQVRPRHSLWQGNGPPPRSPNQGCPIGDDEGRTGIHLFKIWVFPRQHRVMGIGCDEESGLAFLDQGGYGLRRLRQCQGHEWYSPDPRQARL